MSRRRDPTMSAGAVVASVSGGLLGQSGLLPGPDAASAQGRVAEGPVVIPFEGIHQAGIERPAIAQPDSVVASFDLVASDRAGLRATHRQPGAGR